MKVTSVSLVSSVAFKEICPAGPGYQYLASTLQFNQRATEQLVNKEALLVTHGNQDNQGTSNTPSPLPVVLVVFPLEEQRFERKGRSLQAGVEWSTTVPRVHFTEKHPITELHIL